MTAQDPLDPELLDSALLDPETHRRLGVELFNRTWELIRRVDRTAEDDAAMIHTAHASCHHWYASGAVANRARGEWQVARVYCELGLGEAARYHAARCLALASGGGNGLEEWDLPAAHEACAHAELVAGDRSAAERHATEARRLLALVVDVDDREIVESELDALGL